MGKPPSPYRISHHWLQSFSRILSKKAVVGSAEIEKLLYVPLKKILPLLWLDFKFIKPLNRCILYKGY